MIIVLLCPRQLASFGAVGLWAMLRCEVSGAGVAVDAMAAERAEHERVQVQVRARMPLLPPGAAGFWQATPIIACCMALTCC